MGKSFSRYKWPFNLDLLIYFVGKAKNIFILLNFDENCHCFIITRVISLFNCPIKSIILIRLEGSFRLGIIEERAKFKELIVCWCL